MLSTAKMGRASWPYYAQQVEHGACEYYLGLGEAPGRWAGRGLEPLDLKPGGEVSERQLEALFGRALHPESGDVLGNAWRADGVTGFDMCFSAPKSVSALWALADDPRVAREVRAAHAAAVQAGLDYLDTHAALSRVGRDGTTQVRTGGFAAAVFEHRTSRAGDPQLHTHALVVNKLQCADGSWRAIDAREIYGHKKSAGTLYQAALRTELSTRLGLAWGPVSEHGQAEILGVPGELTQGWSTRAAQVEAEAGPVIARYEQLLGRPLTTAERTAVAKVAVLKTRPGKERVAIETLHERWHGQAAELGWTPDRLAAAVHAAADHAPALDRPTTAAQGIETVVRHAVTAAGDRRAVFTRSDLAAEIAARLPVGSGDADLVRQLVERLTDRALGRAVRLRDDDTGACHRASDARYTSPATLDAELRILARADRGLAAGSAHLGTDDVALLLSRTGLDLTQAKAILRITSSGDFLSVLVAPAGTGKTTAIGAAAKAWQRAEYRILGLAPSARAAAELAEATGARADTVAKYLHEHARGTAGDSTFQLDPRTVLIIDEASMLATADLDTLTAHAERAGAKIVLVGDPHQLGTIEAAGGMLPALAHRYRAPSLEQVHRFHERWERDASLHLRAGDPRALSAYRSAGRIHAHPDGDSAIGAVIGRWQHASGEGRRVLMLARSHRDVDALNIRARQHLIQIGIVHGPVLIDGPLECRTGDVLRATRNQRQLALGDGGHVRNGDLFTVVGPTPSGGLHVEHHGTRQRITLPDDYVHAHTAYGWASTIATAQGATTDVGILLARPGLDREHLYVGLTRGREANHVHVAPTDPGEPHHLPAPRGAGASGDVAEHVLADALTSSDTQHAAHTRLTPDQARVRGIASDVPAPDRDLSTHGRDHDRRRSDELHRRLLDPNAHPLASARGRGRTW